MTTHAKLVSEGAPIPSTKSFARHIPTVARVLLGLVFFGGGLAPLFAPPPDPSTLTPEAAAFFGAIARTGYLFPLIKGTEVVAGALLLSNRFVPLALALLAPVLVNILAVNVFLAPSGALIAGVIVLLAAYLAWTYRDAYRPMLSARTTARH